METSAVLNIVIDERESPELDLRMNETQLVAYQHARQAGSQRNVFKNYLLSTEPFVLK